MKNTYQNPIAAEGDFADPFVLRYNGQYYLYCTNRDIRCWSSDDLMDWKAEGPTIEPDTFPRLVPFAPEVVYSNGKFYMYTSPSGYGHYVLESDSPTGPFHKISENVQHAIDGSIFIDDDGTWYFYWAGEEGIWGCEMKSPTEFGDPVFTGATMYGWTEGPFIYKQNGYYYMTYTGNHYLSKGYRINAAWSTHPLKDYQEEVYHPVVIHTQGEVVGLGHSSTVLGPDLVSHYMVYHNMNEDLSRDLDIDRQLWYEHATQVLGPTRSSQLALNSPDYAYPCSISEELTWEFTRGFWGRVNDIYYTSSEGFFAMSEQKFHTSFTAEFHILVFSPRTKTQCGIVFGENIEEYYYLLFDQQTHDLQLWHCHNNESICLKQCPLPNNYVFEALHCIRAEYKKEGKLTIYIDNRLQLQYDQICFDSVSIGYFSENGRIGCGYTAITGTTCEEASENAIIPVDCSFYPVFGSGAFNKNTDGSILLKEGQQVQYQFYTDSRTEYDIFITAKSKHSFSTANILIDGLKIGVWKDGQTVQAYRVTLSAGIHSMKVCVDKDEVVLQRICFKTAQKKNEFEKLSLPIKAGPYEKKLLPAFPYHDYTVSAQLRSEAMAEDSNAGILIRVTEPSEGGEGADPILGIHFFIGYSISFTGNEVVIARHRYDKKILASCPFLYEANKLYDLRVSIRGAEITVFVNKEESPCMKVKDSEPITYGCAGIWAKNNLMVVENIEITQ